MKKLFGLTPLFAVLALSGCFQAVKFGEIAGSVTDISGDPVRGAKIYLDGKYVTDSSPVGTFAIIEVPEGLRTVKAELRIGAATFRGTNRAQVFAFERTTSIGIVVARTDQLANLQGFVEDSFGRRLAGVRVFAGGPLNSWMDITDGDGTYRIDDLVGGYDYTVTASGRGYENDTTTFSAIAGQTGTVNFRLRYSSNQQQDPVENLASFAWTSPVAPDRSREENIAYERIKRIVDPKRSSRVRDRGVPGVNHVEIDLTWDYEYWEELLGYGIYRGTNPTGSLTAIDFLRDPLANFYADISDELVPGIRYYYQVSRINTDFPDFIGSESPLSADTSAVPLDDLILIDPSFFPLTFRWIPTVNVDDYTVYLFSYYPDFQAVPIWVSASTGGTSIPYTGPSLDPGWRYYYVVVGAGYGGNSRTISQIDNFIAP